ncbi:MAG: PmbA/TldA family metallopeptidase [Candidatus Thorarchaeota archaeon]|jgi:predicted Zn-dependent protease
MLDTMAKVIDDLSEKDVAFADIRQESRASTQIMVVNGGLRGFSRATKAGIVARALVGECWGMASTSDALTTEICKNLLTDAVKSAKANAKFSRKNLDFSEIKPIERSVWQKSKVEGVH